MVPFLQGSMNNGRRPNDAQPEVNIVGSRSSRATSSISPFRLAAQILGCKLVEVLAPIGVLITAELVQIIPAVDSRGMHVIEHESHRVVADGEDLKDHDVLLAWNCLALFRRMALHFRARALHSQVFR